MKPKVFSKCSANTHHAQKTPQDDFVVIMNAIIPTAVNIELVILVRK